MFVMQSALSSLDRMMLSSNCGLCIFVASWPRFDGFSPSSSSTQRRIGSPALCTFPGLSLVALEDIGLLALPAGERGVSVEVVALLGAGSACKGLGIGLGFTSDNHLISNKARYRGDGQRRLAIAALVSAVLEANALA